MKIFFLNFLLSVIGCLSQEPKDAADVKCSFPGEFLPDPYDCRIYYICSSTYYPLIILCPTGEYYNPFTFVCQPAGQVQCDVIRCYTPGQLIPDPTDCNLFYICDVNLIAWQLQCPSGQVFDPVAGQCDLPSNMVGHCGAPPGVVCTYPDEIVRDPYDCQVFYICDGNLHPVYYHCGGDQEYNLDLQRCDEPENVDCPIG